MGRNIPNEVLSVLSAIEDNFMCLAGSFQCDTGKQELACLSHIGF